MYVNAIAAVLPVGGFADFALLQAPVAQMLGGAQLPALTTYTSREVDFIIQRGGGDGGGHGPLTVQSLEERDGLEARRNGVCALQKEIYTCINYII